MKSKTLRRKQRRLRRKYERLIALNILFAILIMIVFMVVTSGNNKNEVKEVKAEHETNDHGTVSLTATVGPKLSSISLDDIIIEEFSRNISEEDKHLLAKIAMAEAEGESLETKKHVIMVVLNRVESNEFPDSIEEVIFQKYKGVYQFTPIKEGGRWWTTEPNEECYEAVNFINETKEDISNGALYFESCKGDSWHSRNLDLICEIDNTRFYK